MTASSPKSVNTRARYKRLIIGVTALTGLVLISRQLSIPDCTTIQSKISELGLWAPVGFFLLYVFSTVAFIPGLVVTLMAGLAFGPLLGTAVVSVASTTGATLAFLVARYLARDAVEGILSKQAWFGKFKAGLEEDGFSFVVFTRLVPIFPFNGLNYACGLVPLKLRDYVLGSAIGMLPGTFAYVYLGAAGCSLIDPVIQGRFSIADMPGDVRNKLLIAILLLAVLSLLPVVFKRMKRRATPAK